MYPYKIEQDFIDRELLPAVYQRMPELFPLLHFKTAKGGAKWTSKYHLNGSKGSNGGEQSWVLKTSPYWIGEWGASGMTIFKLAKEWGHGDTYPEQVKWLAESCGLEVPVQDAEKFAKYKADQENKEAALEKFAAALWSGTPEANEVLQYVRSRGWHDEEIRRGKIGYADAAIIGELPDSKIFNVNTSGGDIGGTHRLVMPYRNASSIFGFKFRNIHFKEEDKKNGARKYLNTLGLTKHEGLFGLSHGCDDIVVVEGELDALHAQVRGAARVVATTGNAVSTTQAQNALKMRVRRVTLLFDNDIHGRRFTKESIISFNSYGITDIYVAELPSTVKDTDEYLATHTLEEWNAVVAQAVPVSVWQAKQLVPYGKQLADKNENGKLTYKQQTDIIKYIRVIANGKTTRVHERPSVFKTIEELTSREDMRDVYDWLNIREVKAELDSESKVISDQKRAQATQEAGAKITELLQCGDTDAALKVMRETSTQQAEQSEAAKFAEWFRPKSQAECEKILAQITPGLPTGIRFNRPHDAATNEIHNGELTLETGLTFVCANRAHGKTSFLNNIALNECTRNIKIGNDKSVLYFSYEISEQNLTLDLLNCYVNNTEISTNPRECIRSFFSGDGAEPMNQAQRENFIAAKNKFFRNYLNGKRLIIIDKRPKVGELLASIKYYVSKYPVSLVCIDYAQLIYSEDYSRQRTEEIKRVVNEIKDFANEKGLPFLLAAQFNRQVVSPVSVDTTKIGEGGDFERIADTCIGLFNLKELKPISHDEDNLIRTTLSNAGVLLEEKKPLGKIYDKIFVRLMKRRNGDFPMDTVLDWCGKTKHITPNNPQALEVPDTQRELFGAVTLQQPQPQQEPVQPNQPNQEPQEHELQYYDDEAIDAELTAQCSDEDIPF